jgi:7-cyano-7-deazaguanine tRNA-ribosyltransferase
MVGTSFSTKQKKEFAGRSGVLHISGKKLSTPKFFPIINIMTGPPGIFRTGGIWRGIKNELIKEAKIDAFMSQILHFLDYNISKKTLDIWLEKPLNTRLQEEVGYEPIIFADSGGFKLLFTEGIDTSRYGFSPTPKSILDLQLRLGADLLATLDYPIPPNLSDSEIQTRKQKSIRNGIETLKLIKNQKLTDEKFIYIPVHGYDFSSAYNYVIKTLQEIKKNNLTDINFGLAIGSLVPLSSSYKKMVDIVAGVIQGVRSASSFNWNEIPVHAFGVSGFMMPILAVMGVDTFDSSGFAQSANNLSYMKKFGGPSINFYDLKEDDIKCNCVYCQKIKNNSLKKVQDIMRGKPYKEYDLNGQKIKKYKIYSWIACHNYRIIEDAVEDLKQSIVRGDAIPELLHLYRSDRRMQLLLGYMTRYYENLADSLLEFNLFRLAGREINFSDITWKKTEQIANIKGKTEIQNGEKISLLNTPDNYNVLERTYSPKGKKILLLTSCSKEKPYSSSKTIKTIKRTIEKWEDKVEIVVLSGMYGPVPLSDDQEPEILGYNYLLSATNETRMTLLQDRLVNFLDKYEDVFDHIIAYVTSKPYRILVERISEKYDNLDVYPKDLKFRSGREFTKGKNLKQLNDYLEKKLGGGT